MIRESYLSEIYFEYTRSRGPGGQHVNRTNSAAILHWNIVETKHFTPEQRNRLITALASFITRGGELQLRSDQFRDQDQNRRACIEKLKFLVREALKHKKKRVKTAPTKTSIARRLESKKIMGERKSSRKKVKF